MSDIHHRNILALAEAQKQERARGDALTARVVHLEAQLQMAVGQIESLRQMVGQALLARGHGATTRS